MSKFGKFYIIQWVWLQEYVIATKIKWNYTDYKEKRPSDESIKVPDLFHVDEYFLEFEGSF